MQAAIGTLVDMVVIPVMSLADRPVVNLVVHPAVQ